MVRGYPCILYGARLEVAPLHDRGLHGKAVTEIPKKAHNYVNGFCSDCGAEKPPYTPGDCNEDGKVTKADLLRLQKYLARWDVEINLDAADCNGDGNVSKADLLRLQKHLAGWDVKLGE